jgi:hypothetical protein
MRVLVACLLALALANLNETSPIYQMSEEQWVNEYLIPFDEEEASFIR